MSTPTLPQKKIPSQSKFNKCIDNALTAGTREGVTFDRVNVRVHYVTSKDVNAKKVLQAFCTVSAAISNAKITSARQPATSNIATWVKDFMLKIKPADVQNQPDVTNVTTNDVI